MYLKDRREIYECDKFPGYYIDANTGDFCDSEGNLIGVNLDNGDKPGGSTVRTGIIDVPDYVYISKSGSLYYPKPTTAATERIHLEEAQAKGYKPSRGYQKFVENLVKKHLKVRNSKKKKA